MSKVTEKSTTIEVFEKDDQFWTTSLDVAEKFGKEHEDVIMAIGKLDCSDDFRVRNFIESSYQSTPLFLISRDGFSLLAMGFTGREASEWREKYIEAFRRMENTIRKLLHQREKQLNLEWKQARENGKIARREATEAIQEFCDFCKNQGSQNSHWYYKAITELIYDAVIIPGGNKEILQRKKELKKKYGKDTLSLDELIKVELMERFVVKKLSRKR